MRWHVPTNLDISDKLLRQAHKLGGLRTKKETVTAALEQFIRTRRQKEVLKHMGTIEFREGWDPIRERHKNDHRR